MRSASFPYQSESDVLTQRIHNDDVVVLTRSIHHLSNNIVLERKHLCTGPTLPPVILVHGFAQNRFTWDCSQRSMANYLVAQGYDVWNMELPGHGRSRSPNSVGGESFSEYVQAMISVANYIKEPAFWIGHSLGGATIYSAATQMNPLKTRGIIGVAALYHFGHNPITKVICQLTQRLSKRSVLGAIRIKTKAGGMLLSRLYSISDIVGYTFPLSGWWPDTVEPDLFEERMRLGMDWTNIEIWKEMSGWALSNSFPYRDKWSVLDIPLLVALGDKDHLLTITDGKPAYLESGSHDKELIIFDDYHHDTHWGHLDIILGKKAPHFVWPHIHRWMKQRC